MLQPYVKIYVAIRLLTLAITLCLKMAVCLLRWTALRTGDARPARAGAYFGARETARTEQGVSVCVAGRRA